MRRIRNTGDKPLPLCHFDGLRCSRSVQPPKTRTIGAGAYILLRAAPGSPIRTTVGIVPDSDHDRKATQSLSVFKEHLCFSLNALCLPLVYVCFRRNDLSTLIRVRDDGEYERKRRICGQPGGVKHRIIIAFRNGSRLSVGNVSQDKHKHQ